jgi:hypothetical protein
VYHGSSPPMPAGAAGSAPARAPRSSWTRLPPTRRRPPSPSARATLLVPLAPGPGPT